MLLLLEFAPFTAAHGGKRVLRRLYLQDPDSPTYWMEMLKAMSETLQIGLVVSDMFVPGCPLAYLNEGFATQTGKISV